jgi:hypothetical protein
MGFFRKNVKVVLLCVGIASVIYMAIVATRPSYAVSDQAIRPLRGPWLSQYEGQNVRVTFVSVPTFLGTDLQKTSALTLIEAGNAGIVVSFRPSRTVFFPYCQIAAIEPIYRTN